MRSENFGELQCDFIRKTYQREQRQNYFRGKQFRQCGNVHGKRSVRICKNGGKTRGLAGVWTPPQALIDSARQRRSNIAASFFVVFMLCPPIVTIKSRLCRLTGWTDYKIIHESFGKRKPPRVIFVESVPEYRRRSRGKPPKSPRRPAGQIRRVQQKAVDKAPFFNYNRVLES